MPAGDQVRDAAKKMKEQAAQNRQQAIDMRKAEDELLRVANQLDNEVASLERQAQEVDSAEVRSQDMMNKYKK